MLHPSEIRGLRFPDHSLIRHFYRQGLDQRTGRVLELACGNGCNLQLFQTHGWDCTGLDISPEALSDARWNLGDLPSLIEHDLRVGMPKLTGYFDAVVLAYCLDYLSLAEGVELAKDLSAFLAPGASIFIRTRGEADSRMGKGEPLGPNAYRLDSPKTGEVGVFQQFRNSRDIEEICRQIGAHGEAWILGEHFENPQGGSVTRNHDWIVSGTTAA